MAHGNDDHFEFGEKEAPVRAVDRRIMTEAIRQLDSIDLDDGDDRVDPLPALGEPAVKGRTD